MSDHHLYGLSGLILGCFIMAFYIQVAAFWIAKDYMKQGLSYGKAYWKACRNYYAFTGAIVGILFVIALAGYGVSKMGGGLQDAIFTFLKWMFG